LRKDDELFMGNGILEIPQSTNYWLVRADGGKYYDDFFLNDFIAIADNEVTLEKISIEESLSSIAGLTIESYKKIYTESYPKMNPQQISHAASRTMNFINFIKVNDIVLVPSHRSTEFLLGIVISEVYEISEEELLIDSGVGHYPKCHYKKRRNIIWLKVIDRESISEKMYWILSAHQSIFNLNNYSDHIDKLLSPVYIKGENCYGILKVNVSRGINLNEWMELYQEVQNISGENASQIIIKSNVQSPGLIDFITNIKNLTILLTAFGTLTGILFTKVQIGKTEILGIIPYFFNEGKISRKSMKLDNEMKEIELEQKKAELISYMKEKNIPPISEKLEITTFTSGKVVEFRRQKDTSVQLDEVEPEKL
jgi:restriction system protein